MLMSTIFLQIPINPNVSFTLMMYLALPYDTLHSKHVTDHSAVFKLKLIDGDDLMLGMKFQALTL